jgi:hypothetical protein
MAHVEKDSDVELRLRMLRMLQLGILICNSKRKLAFIPILFSQVTVEAPILDRSCELIMPCLSPR